MVGADCAASALAPLIFLPHVIASATALSPGDVVGLGSGSTYGYNYNLYIYSSARLGVGRRLGWHT